jgi:predicted transposase/invertase (TIGR01784 family)
MTTAELLKKEGKKEGKLEGKLEAARNLLHLNVPLDIVLKATGLSRAELKEAGILRN